VSVTLALSHEVVFQLEELCSSQLVGCVASNDRLAIKDELKIMWKSTYWTYFNVLTIYLHDEIE
jgi:hypothetical protein